MGYAHFFCLMSGHDAYMLCIYRHYPDKHPCSRHFAVCSVVSLPCHQAVRNKQDAHCFHTFLTDSRAFAGNVELAGRLSPHGGGGKSEPRRRKLQGVFRSRMLQHREGLGHYLHHHLHTVVRRRHSVRQAMQTRLQQVPVGFLTTFCL